jgi:hypothetical protein
MAFHGAVAIIRAEEIGVLEPVGKKSLMKNMKKYRAGDRLTRGGPK